MPATKEERHCPIVKSWDRPRDHPIPLWLAHCSSTIALARVTLMGYIQPLLGSPMIKMARAAAMAPAAAEALARHFPGCSWLGGWGVVDGAWTPAVDPSPAITVCVALTDRVACPCL